MKKKQLECEVTRRGEHVKQKQLSSEELALSHTIEGLKKKGLKYSQICKKLIDHKVSAPENKIWSYDLVVSLCKKFHL